MRKLLRALRRYSTFIVVFTLIVEVAFSVCIYFFAPAAYNAKTTLILTSQGASVQKDNYELNAELVADYRVICRTDVVLQRAMENTGIYYDLQTLRNRLQVQSVPETNVLTIEVWAQNGEDAAMLSSAVADSLMLEVSKIYQIDNLQKIGETKIPLEPSRMDTITLLLIGLGVSLLLGCIIALLREYFDDTIHTVDQAATIFGVPVLGQIPHGMPRLRRR